jgi:hypothetical protein
MNPFRWVVTRVRERRRRAVERLCVINCSRGTIVATQLERAVTSRARNRGLLGRDCLSAGEGLWIAPCQAVHTFFMRFAIDLIYIDRRGRIRKLRESVGPWRLSLCLTAHSILELPAGTIRSSCSRRGDQLEMATAPEEFQPATSNQTIHSGMVSR